MNRLKLITKGLATLVAAQLLLGNEAVAGTQETVQNATNNLATAGTYNPSLAPTASNTDDFIFTGTYTSPTFFTTSNIFYGTLNDGSTQAITITDTSATAYTLNLGAAGFSNTYSGTTGDLLYVATGGSLTIQNGTGTLSVALKVAGNLDIAGTGIATITSPFSDGGFGITKTGTGTLDLGGANTVTGTITASAGTLQFGTGSAGTVSNVASTVSSGAILSFGLANGQTYSGAIVDSGTAEGVESAGVTNTLSGLISGAGTFIQQGSGITILTASDTYNGATTVNAGTLQFGTGSQTKPSTPSITVNGGVVSFDMATGNAYTGAIALGTGSGIVEGVEGGNIADTLSGNITGTGTGGFTQLGSSQNGSGVLGETILSGTNNYAGTTNIISGILDFSKTTSLYNGVTTSWTASNIVVQNGGTLGLNSSQFTAAQILAFNTLGTGSTTSGLESGSSLGIDTSTASFTYANAITNNGANAIGLAKLGGNTLTLTAANTYTGPTLVDGGVLAFTGAGSLGSGNYANTIYNIGTLTFGGGSQTLTGSIGGTGALTNSGTGTLTLTGTNVYTGATTVSSGMLDLQNSLALENSTLTASGTGGVVFDSSVTSNAFTIGGIGGNTPLSLQNSTGTAINLTVGNVNNLSSTTTGVLSGSGSLTAFGVSNTLTLEGANTYTGTTTVNGSTLNLGGGTAIGSINGGPLVLTNGVLAYARTGTVSQTFNGLAVSGQSAITNTNASATLNLGAVTDGIGTVDFSSTGTITTTNLNTNGILGGYATYGGKANWATETAGVIGAYTGYTESGTAGTSAAAYYNQNVDVNMSETLGGPITVNTLRFNTNAVETLTLTGLNTVTSGGILITPTVATVTSLQTVNGGTLTGSPSGQLDIISGSTVPTAGFTALTIGSTIVDNGGPTAVVYSGINSLARLNLNNVNNSFSGGLYDVGGGLAFASGGTAFGVGTVTIGNSNFVYTNSSGGSIEFGGTQSMTSGLLQDSLGQSASNGDISNGGAGNSVWTLIGASSGPGSTATFSGIIASYASGRVVNLVLDSGTEIIGNAQNGSNNVTVNGGTLQLGTGYWGSFTQAVTNSNNVGLTVGGGTFNEYGNYAGYTNQGFNSGLQVNSGASTVEASNNGAPGTVINFTTISRSVGGTVNFVLPTGVQNGVNGITTTSLNTNGILGGYATVGGTDWATNATNTAGGNIIGLSSSTINAYSTDTWGTGLNTTVTTNDVLGGPTVTNSLRFNAPGANTVTLTGTNVITSGGILNTINVGANTSTITGGTLEGSSGGDLDIIQNNTGGALTVASIIANNGTATALTINGPGTVNLTGSNTYTGALYLNSGATLNTAGAGINSGVNTAGIFFNGGTLQTTNGFSTNTSSVVSIGVNGGTIDVFGQSPTIGGNITGAASGNGVGSGQFGAFDFTGEGALTVTNSMSASPGSLTFSGAADAFYGGLNIVGNTTVFDNSASTATLGGGYINFNASSGAPTVDLGGNSAVIAGLNGTGTNGTVTNSGGAVSTLTVDGTANSSFNGVITDGTSQVALTVNLNNPTASQTLGGTNGYTGATTVKAGNLVVGNGTSGSINSASAITVSGGSVLYNNPSTTPVNAGNNVTLTGGTLGYVATSSGASTTLGNLTLGLTSGSSTSYLNFGSGMGGNTLTFASLVLASTTTTTVLDVYNYGTSSLNHLLSASSTPVSSQVLSDIMFYTDANPNDLIAEPTVEVMSGSGYEIEPGAAPEPSTYFAAAGLLILLGLGYARKRVSFFLQSVI